MLICLSSVNIYSALKILIERAFVGFEEDHCSWIEVHEVLYSYLPSYCELSATVVAVVPVVGVVGVSSATVVAAVPVVGVVGVSSVTVVAAVPVVGVVMVSEPVKKGKNTCKYSYKPISYDCFNFVNKYAEQHADNKSVHYRTVI